MRYRNTRTGSILDAYGTITGPDWQRVDQPTEAEPEPARASEAEKPPAKKPTAKKPSTKKASK